MLDPKSRPTYEWFRKLPDKADPNPIQGFVDESLVAQFNHMSRPIKIPKDITDITIDMRRIKHCDRRPGESLMRGKPMYGMSYFEGYTSASCPG